MCVGGGGVCLPGLPAIKRVALNCRHLEPGTFRVIGRVN